MPAIQNPEGEIHEDYGIISSDEARKVFVFRQFHSEGFVNQYILNDSLSNNKTLIFQVYSFFPTFAFQFLE